MLVKLEYFIYKYNMQSVLVEGCASLAHVNVTAETQMPHVI